MPDTLLWMIRRPGCADDILQIFQSPGGAIINDRDGLSFRQQPLHQMRTDESRAAGHENMFFLRHQFILPPGLAAGGGAED